MKKIVLLLVAISYAWSSHAQVIDLNKKQLKTVRINTPIKIDGELTEMDWQSTTIASDFIVNEPNLGGTPSQRSEIKVLYDNTAMYIGAMLYDTQPDSILREIKQRDEIGNSDWFGIFLNSYMDGINGEGFIVSAAGGQFDAKYSAFGEDSNWDAVWHSAVQHTSEGWVVEIKIPYSAIRFPNAVEQVWGINFGRVVRRNQEKSFWSKIDPSVNGFLNQFGQLSGIQNIKSPVRLSATPFVALYGENYKDKAADPAASWGRSFNAGMDIKYGINDAFTLDMTLIPDFGQARSDNQVLNLSPFEVQFDENRQFFTEGLELFNKGNLFYSRRVGGRPINYYNVEEQLTDTEEIINNPLQTQLINAAKISGRTQKGLGVGVFNAVSAKEYATVEDTETGLKRTIQTSPLTNYNVTVFDQNLKNNSYVTLLNTNVMRFGEDYDANVTGAVFDLRNKANSYSIRGNTALSQKYFTEETDLGHKASLSLRKTSGNIQGGIAYSEESDTYDPNDLGFLNNNNSRQFNLWVEYMKFKPFGKFNRGGFGMEQEYSRLYSPSAYSEYSLNFWVWAQTKSFWNLNLFTYHLPTETYDYFEARTEGRSYKIPILNFLGVNINSDSRKKLAFGFFGRIGKFSQEGRYNAYFGIAPRYRVNDKLNFQLDIQKFILKNNEGFVNSLETGAQPEIIFGRRDRNTLEMTFNAGYNFSPTMALTFRARHYWSKVEYSSFHLLEENGELGNTDYFDVHDNNFNAFTVDMVYRWRFSPGSDLFVVWKNAIFNSDEFSSLGYLKNINNLGAAPQTNSLSVKFIYYLDYQMLERKKI